MPAARHMAADALCGSGAEQASVTSDGTTAASSSGGMLAASARHSSAATISCDLKVSLSHALCKPTQTKHQRKYAKSDTLMHKGEHNAETIG
jgi:hypothetical protein